MPKHFTTFVIVLLGFIWGSSYILIYKSLKAFTPMQVAGLRMSIGGFILLPWVIKYTFFTKNIRSYNQENNSFSLTRQDYFYLAVSGIIGIGIPSYLFSVAGKFIPSGLSGIITALTPIFTILIGTLLYHEKITKKGALGVLFGLLGVIVIFAPSLLQTTSIPIFPTFLALLSTLMYGYNINLIKHKLSHLPPLAKTAFPLFFVSVIYVLILSQTNIQEVFETRPSLAWKAFKYVFLLGFFSSAVSMLLFNLIIKKTTALAVSSNTFIIPLVAVFWGILNEEVFTWNSIAGLLLIIVSLIVIIKPPKKGEDIKRG